MPPASPTGLRALEQAQRYIGVQENPPGSNRGPLIDKWLTAAKAQPGEPWCAAFAYSMLLDTGVYLNITYPASVGSWIDWANAHEPPAIVARPYRGDLVAYSWDGKTNHPNDHIGYVEKVLALPRATRPISLRGKWFIRTVEGNSSDRVERRWRWVDPQTVAFVRVPA